MSLQEMSSTFSMAVSCAVIAAAVGMSSTRATDVSPRGVCMREGRRLIGSRPVSAAALKRSPKKILDARPRFPALPSTVHGSGDWIGEALLDRRGRVVQVWPIREPVFTVPAPAFNAAIADAVRQWQFEAVFVKAQPAPACVTVTVTIDWS